MAKKDDSEKPIRFSNTAGNTSEKEVGRMVIRLTTLDAALASLTQWFAEAKTAGVKTVKGTLKLY